YLEVSKGETPSASSYLRQFHQNMRVKDSVKGAHISLVDLIKESTDVEYTAFESEALRLAAAVYEGVQRSIPENINVRCNYTLESVVTPDTVNDRFCIGTPTMEGNNNGQPTRYRDIRNLNVNDNEGDVTINGNVGNVTNRNTVSTSNASVNRGAVQVTVHGNGSRGGGGQWKPLTDNDCKKANDLVPTLLHIRVYPVDKYTREELTPIDFIMGVKVTIHPIPVTEIARMVVAGMRNENFVFNFFRWTTGEIKFFKDFLFAIDTIKMDAKDAGNDVTGWRPALKKRRLASKTKLHLTKNSVLPNATMIISRGCIDYIKENYGYDLADERIVNRMMDVYFLLGFVVVDTVTQRVTFRYDGIESTDTYTYDTLRRENQSDDKAFKNMMKMLGRSM
ncbi:MAG: hypothetical protein NC548_28870, partial [Lachnospiraceae bacterium]|nr:hypothetical protein [Lachnospiraceae bacterium]